MGRLTNKGVFMKVISIQKLQAKKDMAKVNKVIAATSRGSQLLKRTRPVLTTDQLIKRIVVASGF